MVQIKTEDSIENNNVGNFEQNELYHSRKFKNRLTEIYSDYPNYKKTAEKLNEEFNCNISGQHVKNLIIKNGAKAISNSEDSNKVFEESFNKLNKRWEKTMEMVDSLIKMYETFKERIETCEDSQQLVMFLKLTPAILQIAQEMRKQLEFIKNQQNDIKESQKTLVLSPTQINYYLSENEARLKKETFKNNPKYKDVEFINELK